MIHKFKLAGYNIVLDVNSGGIHAVDDLTYDILDNIEPPFEPVCPEKVLEKLQKFHRREDIWSCYDEVLKLFDEKLLFSDDRRCPGCSGKTKSVRAICLSVAHDCNLRCRYCFAENGAFGGERCMMTSETARRAVDFLTEMSGDADTLEIYFFGGEPLMNFDVVADTVRYAHEAERKTGKTFRFSLTTNGTLLDDEKTEFINREIHSVVLSADGRREVNDSVRCRADGSGTYDEIMQGFRRLVENRNGGEYYIRGTFTKNNTDFSEDVFSIFEEGFDRISIEPVAAGTSPEYGITELELPAVFREYDRLAEKITALEDEGKHLEFFPFNIDISGKTCDRKQERGCGCGNEYLAVTPEGDVYPCHQFIGDSSMKLGNIYDGMLNEDIRGKFAESTVYTKRGCSECWARYYCSGGCSAAAYHCGGDVEKPHKLSCLIMKKRIECSLAVLVARAHREGKI